MTEEEKAYKNTMKKIKKLERKDKRNAFKDCAKLTDENNKLLDVINGQDVKIADLEQQIEKMKCCTNCKHYAKTYELCCYSLGDEDYDCRLRKWELKE